jgi:thiamine pyrophosphokinase
MKKKLLIIAAGAQIVPEKVRSIINDSDLIIAINGGSEICSKMSINPDYILGDLDSVPAGLRIKFPETTFIKSTDQNTSDMQKALEFATTMNPEKIRIINSFGLRSDHAVSNLLVFDSYPQPETLEIYDNYGIWRILTPGSHDFHFPALRTVSLFSFHRVSGLTLKGFKFPLKDKDFPNRFIGLSNETVEENIYISFRLGKIFIYELMNN